MTWGLLESNDIAAATSQKIRRMTKLYLFAMSWKVLKTNNSLRKYFMISASNQFIRNVIQFSKICTRFLANSLEKCSIQTKQTKTLAKVEQVYNFNRKHWFEATQGIHKSIIKIHINYQVWQIRKIPRVRRRQEVWNSIDSCWRVCHCNSTSWPGNRFFRAWMIRRRKDPEGYSWYKTNKGAKRFQDPVNVMWAWLKFF